MLIKVERFDEGIQITANFGGKDIMTTIDKDGEATDDSGSPITPETLKEGLRSVQTAEEGRIKARE